jgi:predicted metal-binding membrane protein
VRAFPIGWNRKRFHPIGTRSSPFEPRRAFLALLVGLIGLAWLTLFLWELSPHGRYLDHGKWTELGLGAWLCRAVPAGTVVVPALLYALGWVLMIAAMMVPTTLPLLGLFARVTEARTDRAILFMLLIAGYLLAWLAFGLAAHAVDYGLHRLAAWAPWLSFNGWLVGAAVLAVAGAFQFSRLKYACLDKCRAPFSFVNEHWRGQTPYRQSVRLGLHHGLFCVGCCWAIMLLMFVVGTGSVGWMLALGAVMAVEKNVSWGRRLSAPLGIALLGWASFIVLEQGILRP